MSVDDINAKDSQAGSDDSPAGERTRELGNAGEVLTRLDIGLVYSFKKLLNLDILLMHVADRASHYEALVVENEDAPSDSFEKALEFDILSGMLDSEVKELDNFTVSLQEGIFDAQEKISSCEHSNGTFTEIKQKLHDCEESLKQSQDLVAEMRMQSAVFESTIAFGGQEYWNSEVSKSPENSQLPPLNAKMKLQTAEQQRHMLGMLEKSLSREVDLEKRLSELKDEEEELKLKLHHAEGETLSMKETTDLISEKFFEAENVTVVLMGISKELMGKLQIIQFNLNSSIQREGEARLKLQNSTQFKTLSAEINNLKTKLKQAEDKCIIADTEVVTLREKVNLLEGQLRESDSQLELVKASVEASQEQQHLLSSEINDLESVIEDLRESVSKAESRAESLECKCKLLAETNLELNEELGLLRNNNGIDKVNFLEKQLQQYETQLQHAKATVEASKEQQTMLNSTLHDMENLIEDLKVKATKAEGRAEIADSKCVLLTETNLELNQELGFLRSRIECLETSLHQADDAKIATAKDIGVRTKVITNLVMQLAMERERLQTEVLTLDWPLHVPEIGCQDSYVSFQDWDSNSLAVYALVTQIFSLRKEVKYWKAKNDDSVILSHDRNEDSKGNFFPSSDSATAQHSKSSEEVVTEPTSFQVDKLAKDIPACPIEAGPTISAEDAMNAVSKLETVRSIGAGQLNSKHILMAFLVLLISMVAVYIFQLENCPF